MSLIGEIIAGPPPRRSFGRPVDSFSTSSQLSEGAGQEVVALMNGTVNRAVKLKASTMAGLPPRIIRRGDIKRTEVREARHQHIWGRPNPRDRRINVWESSYAMLDLLGNAYFWKGAGRRNEPELWYIRPGRVKVGDDGGEKVFTLDNNMNRRYTSDEIMHISGFSTDGLTGDGLISALATPVNIIAKASRYGESFFDNGATVSGVLKTEAKLTDEQVNQLRERWREQHVRSEGGRQHDIAILGHGADFTAVAITQEQAQYRETLEHWEVRIGSQILGVPPHMLGIVDRSTSWGRGLEQQAIAFVTYTLLPALIRTEQAIEDELLEPQLEMKWVLNGLLRGDTVQRFAAYRTGIFGGFQAPDEVRAFEDMPPRPDGRGMEFVNPSQNTSGMRNGGGDGQAPGTSNRDEPEASRPLTSDETDDLIEALDRKLRADHYSERTEQTLSTLVDRGVCPDCGKMLASKVNAGAEIRCPRCQRVVPVVADAVPA